MNTFQKMTKTQLIEFLIDEMTPKDSRPSEVFPNIADAYEIGYHNGRMSDAAVLKKILELLGE